MWCRACPFVGNLTISSIILVNRSPDRRCYIHVILIGRNNRSVLTSPSGVSFITSIGQILGWQAQMAVRPGALP
jgi:hypothetical protein